MGDLTAKVVTGLDQVREWVRSTFHITDSQFTTYFEQLKSTISAGGSLGSTAAKAGLTATHFVAGTFLALFSLIFFLYDGRRIASWLVGLFPAPPGPRSTAPRRSRGTSSPPSSGPPSWLLSSTRSASVSARRSCGCPSPERSSSWSSSARSSRSSAPWSARGRGAARPGRPRAGHGPRHARRGPGRPTARGAHPPAVPPRPGRGDPPARGRARHRPWGRRRGRGRGALRGADHRGGERRRQVPPRRRPIGATCRGPRVRPRYAGPAVGRGGGRAGGRGGGHAAREPEASAVDGAAHRVGEALHLGLDLDLLDRLLDRGPAGPVGHVPSV